MCLVLVLPLGLADLLQVGGLGLGGLDWRALGVACYYYWAAGFALLAGWMDGWLAG